MIKKAQPNLSSQKGIATILTVMLVGIVLVVTILGTSYYIRAKQQAGVANHAVTNAQSGAWIGVELLRKYFESLNKTQIDSLQTGSINIGLSGITASIDTITAPTNSTDPYQLIATIKNVSSNSKSASSVRILYQVVPPTSSGGSGGGGGAGTTSAMDIYSDLDLTGGIKFSKNGTENVGLNVYGNFSTGGVGLTGIDTLSTTGNVTVTSSAYIKNIYTNGNVTLEGSARADLISAKGWIYTKSGGTQGDLYADKYISITNGSLKNANTFSYIDWPSGGGTAQILTAGGYVNFGSSSVNTIRAKGNVNLSTWGTVSDVMSEGKIKCVSTNWGNYTLLKAVSFESCPTKNATTLPAGTDSIVATGALVTVTAPNKPLVNALSYESQANYILDVDSNSKPVVTVKNVNGIPSGKYYIAKYTSNNIEYIGKLCPGIDTSGFCTGTSVGYIYPPNTGSWNTVISYSGGTWSLRDNNNQDPSLAPGVFLFKGNLNPQTGKYANAFLSTGSITYGTSIILEAPNYAGANKVCNSTGFGRPTNLCSSNTALIPAAIGNIALLAGSCTNATTAASCQATYSGGNITLESSAKVYGNVIAGNLLNTSGDSTIVGSLLAAGLGDITQKSKFSGSTTIDLTSLKDHPDFSTGDNSSNSGSTSTGSGTTTATVKWARYL